MIRLLKTTSTKATLGLASPNLHYSLGFRKRMVESMKKRQAQEVSRRQQALSEGEKEEIRKVQEELSEEDKQLINAYKVDKVWNLLIKESPDHNFQKDIIVHRKQFQKSTRELRSAILFEDLLKTEIDIPIYDTKGKPYAHNILKFLYLFFTAGAAVWTIYALRKHDPKNSILLDRTTEGKIFKYSVYFLSGVLFVSTLMKYSNFRRKYVERIVYNTEKEEFTFTKRNFFGLKYNYVASRFKILYTQNAFLNRQGTNYFDIDTKQEFSIVYTDSWIKQDLFSHLIYQRIKI